MDMTSNDIRHFEFQNQLRGYDKDDVDGFKDQVAQGFELLQQENVRLSMELESVKEQLADLKQFEDAIKSAAIDARKNADSTMAEASQQADKLLSEAKNEAKRIIQSNRIAIEAVDQQLTEIKLTRASYLKKLRDLLKDHMTLVNSIEKEPTPKPTVKEDKLDITASSEVDESQVESLANDELPAKTQSEEKLVGQAIMSESSQTGASKDQQSSKKSDTEQLKEVLADDKPAQGKNIDPELAAALNNYKKNVDTESDQQPTQEQTPAPAPGEFVETNARAEDVPEGFVAMGEETQTPSTDRVNIEGGPDSEKPADQIDLASELDNVAAKFEEEMDKAEKN